MTASFAATGGGGAVAIFAVFIVACVVLAAFVITFAVRLNRRSRAQQAASEVHPPAADESGR